MTANPNSALHESLSVLMDGECNELDLQRVLKSMDTDGEAERVWSRYHATSQMIKGEGAPDLSIDLSASIRQAIADEEAPASERKLAGLNHWWRGAGKTAVAACAAVGVVLGAQQFTGMDADLDRVASVANTASENEALSGAVVPQGFELPPLQARTVSTDSYNANAVSKTSSSPSVRATIVINSDEFQDQINRLMFKHAEQVSSSGGLGTVPFARISELSEQEQE